MWGDDWSWWSWGAASWSEDRDAAVAQAYAWIASTAEARGWSASTVDQARALVQSAAAVSNDVIGFWRTLASLWDDVGGPEGWDELRTTWLSATGAAETTSESRELGELGVMVRDAAEATADDLAEMADPRLSWVPWAAAAAVLGVLWTVTR